ncbi:MAG: hypothetical protein LBK43_01455 [Treponema sp.]|jgi:hypothetical protein|nr:hypothetical protein [Treponema sp.]
MQKAPGTKKPMSRLTKAEYETLEDKITRNPPDVDRERRREYIRNMDEIVAEFNKSAFRHYLSKEDILHAFRSPLYNGPIEGVNYKDKYLRLGVDRAGNLIEIVYHEIDERTYLIFHAMKCQNKYNRLLN